MGESISRIKGRESALAVLGASLLWCWEYGVFLSMFSVPGDAAFNAPLKIMRFAFLAASSLMAFALWLILKKRGRSFQSAMAMSALFLLACATTFVGAAEEEGSPLFLCAVGVALGIPCAFATIAWCSRLSLEGQGCAAALLASFVLSFVLFFVVYFLPNDVRAIVAIAMPAASGFIWWVDYRFRRNIGDAESDLEIIGIQQELFLGDSSFDQISWQTLLSLGLIAFFGEMMVAFVLADEKPALDALSLFCSLLSVMLLAIALVKSLRAERDSVTLLCCFAAPVAVLGLLSFLIFGHYLNAFVGGMLQCSSYMFQVAVYAFLLEIGWRRGLSPVLSFGVGIAVLRLVMLAGDILGDVLYQLFGSNTVFLSALPAAAILTICVVLSAFVACCGKIIGLEASDMGEGMEFARESQDAHDVWLAREAAVKEFAAEYGLSPRETEVLGYLLSGRSAPAIAEKMVITTGTVKTHLVHIYKKMDVGGRQEVVDKYETMLDLR